MGVSPERWAAFVSFTADEWKNWILYYSVFSLHGIIPQNHFECWCLLVDACQLLCQPILNTDQVHKAHHLLVQFCKTFENLYGSSHCTPNMHMSCHLKDCILDFGPLSSFWCFPFERYNGFLEGFQKSWNGPEKQMIRKFLSMQYINSQQDVTNGGNFINTVRKGIEKHSRVNTVGRYGSFDQTTIQDLNTITCIHNTTCSVASLDGTQQSYHCLIRPFYEKSFNDSELACVKKMYSILYPSSTINQVSRLYLEARQMLINSEEFISEKSRSAKSSLIAAHWPGVVGIDPQGEAPLRVGSVISFIQHKIVLENREPVIHNLARISWLQDHPRRSFLRHSNVFCATVNESDSEACFMPVCRIAGRCAFTKTGYDFDYGHDNVAVCIPVLKFNRSSPKVLPATYYKLVICC